MAAERFRVFACVLYPESMPANCFDLINDLHIETYVSPLHDRDKNANGEEKKPHYHVLMRFDGAKSREQVKNYFSAFGGVGCETVASFRAYARYLCHLDNPEKAQYSQANVKCFSGADYYDAIHSSSDVYKLMLQIDEFILTGSDGIYCYRDLVEYCIYNDFEWYKVVCDRCQHFTHLLNSQKYSHSPQKK